MDADAESLTRAQRVALSTGALAVLAILASLVTSVDVTIRSIAALAGVWLLFASLIQVASLRRRMPMPMFRRPIPIRFSGNLGRFTLRVRGDGRRVEVRAGAEIVAEAIATDERDELVVDLEAVDDGEIEALGAAVGAAIEMVAVADDARWAEQLAARINGGGRPRYRPTTGGVLRSIGSRSP